MSRVSKKRKAIRETVLGMKPTTFENALALLKQFASERFIETVEVHLSLGIDPKDSRQGVRSSVVLPHGTGKVVRVAVFAQGANAEAAKTAGADIVGFEDLAADIKKGEIGFDVLIASPDAMRLVGQLGQILGPRGLMPNPKLGTVTPNVAEAVHNAKAGQVRYRADKGGILHCGVGKLNFEQSALYENFLALLADVKKAKPATSKGVYLKKAYLSSTMGPGVPIDLSSL